MKILVIGGARLIGSKTFAELRHRGHDVTAASPTLGVNTITGERLDTAMAGIDVVIDVTKPSFHDDKPYWNFSRPLGATCSRRSTKLA